MNKEREMKSAVKKFETTVNTVYENSKILVMGEGSLDSLVMLVGEAPGEQETMQKRPFVGKAGKNLDSFLHETGLNRDKLYITNTVKFRPTKVNEKTARVSNRPPSREEIALCLPFLREEMRIVAPKVVVTLGNVALKAVSGNPKATIGTLHGAMVSGAPVELFALYHPASVIYNRSLAETYMEDLRTLRRTLEQVLD